VFRMSQHGKNLIAPDTREPLQEVVHRGARFEVFEQGAHGAPRSLEDPRATNPVGHPFNGRTRLPVQHAVSIGPFALDDNVDLARRRTAPNVRGDRGL
jgi:hypothetical protein